MNRQLGERKRGRPRHDDILTPAEWKVVRAAQHGLTNAEIAEKQGVTIDAVKFHIANAVAKLGVHNKKALMKWVGGQKNSAFNKDSTMTKETKFESIGQIARSVKNVEKSTAWYRDVLGLKHLYSFESMAFFQCGETRIMLSSEQADVVPESIIYLRTSDVKARQVTLESNGVNFTHVPHMIHQHEDGSEEWMAFIEDLEGRPIGLMATYPSN